MVEVGKMYQFKPDQDLGYQGPVTVLRELGDDERDLDDVGRMFEVHTTHGRKLHAFLNELHPMNVFMDWYTRGQ
jgi:hypothetical protein